MHGIHVHAAGSTGTDHAAYATYGSRWQAWDNRKMEERYYGPDLALVHHLGFGFHADRCAPGVIELLRPVADGGGLVVELGCGTGRLTEHLVDGGHRVLATDASPAMLDLARTHVAGAEGIESLRLPDDAIPAADAIVAVGHPLNYLPDVGSIVRAVESIGKALLPGGVVVFDICDLEWGRARADQPTEVSYGQGWVLITEYCAPSPDRFDRLMTMFIEGEDGTWRRSVEAHGNVLIDSSTIPAILRACGVEAEVGHTLGAEVMPTGLHVVTGRRH